jgi:hypothetical protein
MYPDQELERLAWHKARLRQRISVRRVESIVAVEELTRPLLWLDRAAAWWKQVRPFAKLAAIPLALLAKRLIFPRVKLFRSVFRWGPAIFGAVRMANAMRRS